MLDPLSPEGLVQRTSTITTRLQNYPHSGLLDIQTSIPAVWENPAFFNDSPLYLLRIVTLKPYGSQFALGRIRMDKQEIEETLNDMIFEVQISRLFLYPRVITQILYSLNRGDSVQTVIQFSGDYLIPPEDAWVALTNVKRTVYNKFGADEILDSFERNLHN